MKFLKRIQKVLPWLVVLAGVFFLLTPFIKGQVKRNILLYQQDYSTQVGGPYEASNSTSRYALTESIVTNNTFFLTKDLAKFSAPDVTYYKGKYTTVFTPGVSFISVPFYFLGSQIGLPELFTFGSTLLLAILNVLLITRISQKLGTGFLSGLIGGLIFLFGTNALAYSLTLTQHHASTFVVLFAILNSLEKRNIKNNIVFGILFGAGLLIDIPNAFFLIPMFFFIISSHVESITTSTKKIFTVRTQLIWLLVGLIPLLMLFGWYNHQTTGSYTKLSQLIGRTEDISQTLQKQKPVQSAPLASPAVATPKALGIKLLPFYTRLQLSGLYTLVLSDERSWLYYSPIVFIGVLGLFLLYKREETRTAVLICSAVILIDILLYSMFSDPWGGWSFGPRYLIPAAAILCIGIGTAVEKCKKNPWFIGVFWILLFYSLTINILGALTTAAIPPKVEAVNLSTHIPYTYEYNRELLLKNFSSSLTYNVFFARKISTEMFYFVLLGSFSVLFVLLYIALFLKNRRFKR